MTITTLVSGFVAFEIYESQQQALADVRSELKVFSAASASQLKQYLDSVSEVLTVAGQVASTVLQQEASPITTTSGLLRTVEVGTPVSNLIVVGRNGDPVVSSHAVTIPKPFTAGPAALRALRGKPPGKTIVLGPIRSEAGDNITYWAARRVESQTGEVLGAVLAPLNVASIAFVGRDAVQKNGVTVAVIDLDTGRLIARFPDPGVSRFLKNYAGDFVTTEISRKHSGELTATSEVDGVKRLMSFDRVGSYPLVTITSMAESAAEARWHNDALRILLTGYLSLTVVMLLLVIINRQLRHLARRTRDIAESEQRFDRVIQQLSDALFVRDQEGRILVANKQFAKFFGVSDEQSLVGRHLLDLQPIETAEQILRLNAEVLRSRGTTYTIESEMQSSIGDSVPIEYTLSAVEIGGQNLLLGQLRDISARRSYEAQLVKQATFDDITGLPNRRLFMDRLSTALHHSKRTEGNSAVIFVDLDHFKRVNDTLGHRIGDRLLELAARRLNELVQPEDTVARFGGDEFVLLLPEVRSPIECRGLAERIVTAFRQPFELAGRSISITTSVGIAIFPEDGTEPDLLLKHADTAVYEAKTAGRNDFCFFNQEMNVRVHEMLQIDERIRLALERDEISLLYQPIVDPRTGEIVKAEALARWFNPELGHVSPDKFIPAAEENGLITAIGDWVLHKACKDAASWAKKKLPPITVSVNVSAKQFDDPAFVDTVYSALDESGLPPHLLELEITERLLISEDETSLETIGALRELGVGLSLDDFGTGYSSLSYLTKFPLNTIKIDRTFVRDLEHDGTTQTLTRAIIALAKSLDLKLVAEGVETREQAEKLIELGAEYLQGYYLGRPMSSENLLSIGLQ
ncbi:bifunctional diguanylate cyclase/phosphodiesterase [Ralstonia pseudosolanacearum]|uniref:bifunctional diguanylate cyclase/phosphodiesterase n=1 Tax=Ralstonia pseudosolanacearum TaxID=1310165 RepID=UPI003CFA757C